MNSNYTSIYNLLQKENLYGLDSIRCLLYMVIIPVILKKNNYDEIKVLLNHNNFIKFEINFKCSFFIDNLINLIKNIKYINLNEIFIFYLNNDTIQNNKNYIKYYNNPLLSEWIINLSKPNSIDKIFDGNLKINSYLNEIIKYFNKNNIKINIKNLYGYQNNEHIKEITNLELYLNSNINFDSNILFHNLLFNDINNIYYDLIFFDINNDIHNIIHAKCCNKIKELKIRGTKYEPLILQLILKSLNMNGRAIVIVPYSLLYCDSIQHTETRKYLLDNYNLKKIIEIDDSLNNIKTIKKFILYIENNIEKKDSIMFSKIKLLNNNIIEENIINIEYNKIINNNYILDHNIYINNINLINEKINYVNINNYYDFYYKIDTIPKNINNKIIIIPKYYKNTNIISINYDNINNYSDIILYLIEKENNDYIKGFLNYYIEYIINNKYNNFIKGVLNQIDIEKIKNINLPILNKNNQNIIYNYYEYSIKLYDYNLTQINLYKNMIKCIFDSINNFDSIELENIIEIKNINEIDLINNKYIGIIKNGLNIGNILYIDKDNNNDNISNNLYYLKIINNDYLFDFIFNYLKYLKNHIKIIVNLNKQPVLNKGHINTLKIPMINIDTQKEINYNISVFNSIINKNLIDNSNIKNKDLINLILKINNLS